MPINIAIIDYDAGNLKSVEKALQSIGEDTIVSRDREEILRADKVILPGVGSFGDAMQKLRDYKLDEVIKEVTESGKPFLGICLGLQLLFERSEETPGVEGLGILKGEILRIPDHEGLKIPHMGWNSLELINQGRLFQNLPADPIGKVLILERKTEMIVRGVYRDISLSLASISLLCIP